MSSDELKENGFKNEDVSGSESGKGPEKGFSRKAGDLGNSLKRAAENLKKKTPKELEVKKVLEKMKKIDAKTIKKNYLRITLVVLVLALVLSRTVINLRQIFIREVEITDPVEFLETTPVKAYKVRRMDFKDTLPVLGRIEGFKHIELRFQDSGILENYNFEEGERILAGDIIASLDQRDALLKLRYAALELDKAQKLYDIGGVEQPALEQRQLEYESARRELERTNIYATSDGYLGAKDIHAGAYVTPQDKIGTFVDFRDVYAAFDVIEEDSPKVRLGQNVDIFVDAYPGSAYRGRVDMLAPMIKGRTRTQRIKVELSNDEDEFRPGMFARAVINTYEKPDALIIPAAAFRREDNRFFVYVIHEESDPSRPGYDQGIVEVREIRIAYMTHDVVEVEEGLVEGELIIRELHREYQDDEKVEITEIQETIF